MSASTESNDWIDWHGGECPVAPETMVDGWLVCDATESEALSVRPSKAGLLRWSHIGGLGDIIKYRIVGEAA